MALGLKNKSTDVLVYSVSGFPVCLIKLPVADPLLWPMVQRAVWKETEL